MRSARRILVGGLGAFVALAGLEHGVGEVLQGSVAPAGVMFPSWPASAFFRILGGEPAMSIVPNMLVTGILAIIVSLGFLAWATVFARRKWAGLTLVGLSLLMLLVGAGFGPPILGVIVGATALKIDSPLTWYRAHLSPSLTHSLAVLWPWTFGACLLGWLALTPGLPALAQFIAIDGPTVIPVVFLCALLLLVSTVFTGFAYDIDRTSLATTNL